MSSVLMDIGDTNDEKRPDYLYPHGTDCLSVLVPKSKKKISFMYQVVRYDATLLIFITYLLFSILRIFMKCAPLSEWFLEFFKTLGFCLAQQKPRNLKSRRDYMWLGGVLMFSYVVVALLSSILYQSLVMSRFDPEIDTVEQLANSNLKIVVPDDEHTWAKQSSVVVIKILSICNYIFLILVNMDQNCMTKLFTLT